MGRNSRYIRWRRSTDEDDISVQPAKNELPSKVGAKRPSPLDTLERTRLLKQKLIQLIDKFTGLFDLFTEHNDLTYEYLASTDELMML